MSIISNKLIVVKKQIQEAVLGLICAALMIPGKKRNGRAPFDYRELKEIYKALLSQNLCCINGSRVRTLESEFALSYGVPYAVASTSGTAAIHVALGALDLNPGDEVITAPITDLGTVIPILYQNAIPVFADVDHTYNMDPEEVERRISARTRAILVVHLFGNPCDMEAMVEIARRHNLALIEDCSQTHMTKYKGQYVGTIGDIGCFSFQQSKHMTTGDGGITITGNKLYYERMKLFADKGYARKGWGSRAYLFHAPNYRMTELVGAVGLAQLDKVRAVVAKRAELGRLMTERLANIPSVMPAPVTPGAEHSYWLYPIRVKGTDIQQLAGEMMRNKIPVLSGYTGKPIYLCSESLTSKKTYGESQCPFTCQHTTGTYEYKEGLCPRAEEALKELICVIWDESWTQKDVERVANTVATCLKTAVPSRTHGLPKQPIGELSSRISGNGHARKARIGIIGCGQIGRWHLDSYKSDGRCEIVACVDPDFERARKFANEVGAAAYRSHKEMLEQQRLDGASICTVPATHKAIALDLLDSGIHVLCEKPLAVSLAQAEEMHERAAEKNLLLLPAFKFRFYDEVLKAKELIAQGGLGRIVSFRLMFGGSIDMAGTWYSQAALSGGGVIMDNGPHAVDLIRFVLGEVRTVVAHASTYQEIGVEDTAQLTLTLENGVVGTSDLSWTCSVPTKTYLEIYGEGGTLLVDFEGISYTFKTWNRWQRIPNNVKTREAFARQINHFLDAMAGQGPTRLTNADGSSAQAVIDAAYESLDRHQKILVANGKSDASHGS
jgi:perosamine synthetase